MRNVKDCFAKTLWRPIASTVDYDVDNHVWSLITTSINGRVWRTAGNALRNYLGVVS